MRRGGGIGGRKGRVGGSEREWGRRERGEEERGVEKKERIWDKVHHQPLFSNIGV